MSHSDFESSESKWFSFDFSHSLVVSEFRSALNNSSGDFGRGTRESGALIPRGSWSSVIELSTFWAVASGRRKRTSALTIGEVELLVSLEFAEADDDCDARDVDRVWLGSSGWGD